MRPNLARVMRMKFGRRWWHTSLLDWVVVESDRGDGFVTVHVDGEEEFSWVTYRELLRSCP